METEAVIVTTKVMVSLSVFITCNTALFLAVIGVYGLAYKIGQDTNKKIGDIYEAVNGHVQKASIHTDKSEFTSAAVCVVIHKNVDEKLNSISKDVKTLLAKA